MRLNLLVYSVLCIYLLLICLQVKGDSPSSSSSTSSSSSSSTSSSSISVSSPIDYSDEYQVLTRVLRPARSFIRTGKYERAIELLLTAVEQRKKLEKAKKEMKNNPNFSSDMYGDDDNSTTTGQRNQKRNNYSNNGNNGNNGKSGYNLQEPFTAPTRISIQLLDHQIMAELLTAGSLVKLVTAPNLQSELQVVSELEQEMSKGNLEIGAYEARLALLKYTKSREGLEDQLVSILKHPESINDTTSLFTVGKLFVKFEVPESAIVGFLAFLNATMFSNPNYPLPTCSSSSRSSRSKNNHNSNNNNNNNNDDEDYDKEVDFDGVHESDIDFDGNVIHFSKDCVLSFYSEPSQAGFFPPESPQEFSQLPMGKKKDPPRRTLPGTYGWVHIPYPETLDQASACLSLGALFYEKLQLWKHAEMYMRCALAHPAFAKSREILAILINALSFQGRSREATSAFGLLSVVGLPFSDNIENSRSKSVKTLYTGPYKANPGSGKLYPFSTSGVEGEDSSSDFETFTSEQRASPRHWTAVKLFEAEEPVIFDNIASSELLLDVSYGLSSQSLLYMHHSSRGRNYELDSHYVSFGRFPRTCIEQAVWIIADTLPKSARADVVGAEWWITRRPEKSRTRGIPGEIPKWHFDYELFAATGQIRYPKYIAGLTFDNLGGPIIIINSTLSSASHEQFDATNHTSWLSPTAYKRVVIFPGHYQYGILPADRMTPGTRNFDNAVLWIAFWTDQGCLQSQNNPGPCFADEPPEYYEGGVLPVADELRDQGREGLAPNWQNEFHLVTEEEFTRRKQRKPRTDFDKAKPLSTPRKGKYSLKLDTAAAERNRIASGGSVENSTIASTTTTTTTTTTSLGNYAGTQQEIDEAKEYEIGNPMWNSWRVFGSESLLHFTLRATIDENRTCSAAIPSGAPYIPMDHFGKARSLKRLQSYLTPEGEDEAYLLKASPFSRYSASSSNGGSSSNSNPDSDNKVYVNQTVVLAVFLANVALRSFEYGYQESSMRLFLESSRIFHDTPYCSSDNDLCTGVQFNFTDSNAYARILHLINQISPFPNHLQELESQRMALEEKGDQEALTKFYNELARSKKEAVKSLIDIGGKFPRLVASVPKLVLPYLLQEKDCKRSLPHFAAISTKTAPYNFLQARILCLIHEGEYEEAVQLLEEAIENRPIDKYPCKILADLYSAKYLNDPLLATRYQTCYDNWKKWKYPQSSAGASGFFDNVVKKPIK